jgi:hypothetical protein
MKAFSAICLCVCLAVAALRAQESGLSVSKRESASVQGIVVKDPEGAPLKKALIELIAESQNANGNYTAISTADGAFSIANIAPGRYRLYVERAGYQEAEKSHRSNQGRLLTIIRGQDVKDLVIHLQASAVVQGRITDEDGDPMAEAQVSALRRTYVAGRVQWEQAGAERTNDLGEFRIAGLPAGSYFVSITPPPDFRSLIESHGDGEAGPERGENAGKPTTSYQIAYYPGTRDRAQATPIELHPGDEFPMNFSLTPAPSLSIRGSVVNLPPGSVASVSLNSGESLIVNATEVRRDGSFEIRHVAPGAYTISARVENAAPPMMARQPLAIADANVEGIHLSLQAGGLLRGRLRVQTDSPRLDVSQVFLLLRPDEELDDPAGGVAPNNNFSTIAQVRPDGTFEWKDVAPGQYTVQISEASAMPDLYLKAATAGGHDILESGVAVNGGSVGMDLVASDRGASIAGFAADAKDRPVPDAMIVAVPERRLRSHPDRYFKAAADQLGRFTLRGLPPGEYTLFAWERLEGEPYFNPEFLQQYQEPGTSVHVKEGQRESLRLRVIAGTAGEP